MTHCGWCGDNAPDAVDHDCWVKAKIADQEDLPPPPRVGDQIDPYGQVEYIQP